MNTICSILIPSRARFDRLLRTVESFVNSTSQRLDILVKFDIDDTEALRRQHELSSFKEVRVLFGPRVIPPFKSGYCNLHLFYEAMAYLAFGRWLWIMNDDTTIEAEAQDWVTQLGSLPPVGVLAQPEHISNPEGTCIYTRSEGGPFPVIAQGSWLRYKPHHAPDPIDTCIDQTLCKENGWKTYFLEGVTIRHYRDPGDVLEQHRK